MPDERDGELLRRFVQGDHDAFESLFRQFEIEVFHWILGIVGDANTAEDVLVEAFWRASRVFRAVRALRKDLASLGIRP